MVTVAYVEQKTSGKVGGAIGGQVGGQELSIINKEEMLTPPNHPPNQRIGE